MLVCWTLSRALSGPVVANSGDDNDARSSQLFDLLNEWVVLRIFACCGKINDVDVVVQHEVKGIQEPGGVRHRVIIEQLENINFGLWSNTGAKRVLTANDACDKRAMAVDVSGVDALIFQTIGVVAHIERVYLHVIFSEVDYLHHVHRTLKIAVSLLFIVFFIFVGILRF